MRDINGGYTFAVAYIERIENCLLGKSFMNFSWVVKKVKKA
ncbi:hypothetical protein CFAL_01650 [Corynebacterium falsenii DSM 44353]|nr:hypothetical protein [Corynebacterium falsenii]AHI04207.1 hypothetical protein CFAL_01650 [Corynebacterium falsenii DSM 44353]